LKQEKKQKLKRRNLILKALGLERGFGMSSKDQAGLNLGKRKEK
jgi:hypothetical protein